MSSKAIERATAAANPWNIVTIEDGYPSAFERSREEIAVSVLTAALDPGDPELIAAVERVFIAWRLPAYRDGLLGHDVITALRTEILGGAE